MPIIVETNESILELVRSVTGPGAKVVANLDELRRELNHNSDEYAVVLGPSVDLSAASALADSLRVSRPALSVILIRRRVDTSVLAEALRSGMREVVEERDLSGVSAAIKRAHQVYAAVTGPHRSADSQKRGRVVTVFSPKGGVGKTTVSANLAVLAVKQFNLKTVLVDLDLSFGDVAITLQIFPSRTIADVVALQNDLDFASLEPLLTPHKIGFSTLVAPVQPDAKDSIAPALVSQVLATLKDNFELVIVDTSPSFDEHVLQAFDETDELVLVTTLDVPTLKNVKIACETLDLLNFPKEHRHLLLNRADDKVGLAPDKVESTLKLKIVEKIPTSSEVANATNAGEPLTSTSPKHPVSQAFQRAAEKIFADALTAAEAPAKPEAKRSRLRRGGRSS